MLLLLFGTGPDSVFFADMVGEDAILITLDQELVVDAAFKDVSNYSVQVISGVGEVSVRRVIFPATDRTTTQILLSVDRPVEGTRYRVTMGPLRSRSGVLVNGVVDFIGRRTKLGSMLQAIPHHWDTSPGALMRSTLAAISIEDDRIGGSRKDRL